MIIVDDHLAIIAAAGGLVTEHGPVATTYAFWYRLARAVRAPGALGSLSREVEAAAARRQILNPPADRLLVLDPRVSVGAAVDVATRHGANLLLAELVGAARHHGATVRVTGANLGRTWAAVLEAEGVELDVVEMT